MKKGLVTLAFILIATISFAQSITGDWYGVLDVNGAHIHLVFHIASVADKYTTTWDSPDQGGKQLATTSTTVIGNQVTIDASAFNIKYTGTFVPDSNKIKGTFAQGAALLPLILSTNKNSAIATKPAARLQDPKDFPYKQEEVTFINPKAGDKLAGTLTMPANGKVSKVVVLITGSGPQNRNEELFNHRPFLVWSDWLTRHGIAVLRYDDRGIAKSTGDFATATTADFAEDAEAAVNYLNARADLKGAEIGLMGHSEGGIIAPMVASRNRVVKFVVLLAGPGVPSTQLLQKQSADQMRLLGAPEGAITQALASNEKIYKLIKDNQSLPTAQFKVKADTLLYQIARQFSSATLGNQTADDFVKTKSVSIVSPWFRYFMILNPHDYLKKVTCPLLAINGTLDKQVSSAENLAGIKASMEKVGNKHYAVVPLTGLNHLLQKATTGSLAEYGQIEETIDPIALKTVNDWIGELK
ncbi:alpha/beta hydrolase family protein [Mucilaginibacter flavus]|uniref:alpha/beta hydrolase family protein n=1 Tax=Mucilaginibacter flavus TaxID=931504 RepID=UPI0025B3E825|nr:alpha/beta hydrolase [Mucilaginibacter flavus]MDN3580088.1 alpha/beta hydrolase [Mucilaginibacter flavus]